MLITPRPGANRQNLLQALRQVHTAVSNLRGGGAPDAQGRLVGYLEWAIATVQQLSNQISAADPDQPVLPRSYDRLLSIVVTMTGGDIATQRRPRLGSSLRQPLRDAGSPQVRDDRHRPDDVPVPWLQTTADSRHQRVEDSDAWSPGRLRRSTLRGAGEAQVAGTSMTPTRHLPTHPTGEAPALSATDLIILVAFWFSDPCEGPGGLPLQGRQASVIRACAVYRSPILVLLREPISGATMHTLPGTHRHLPLPGTHRHLPAGLAL